MYLWKSLFSYTIYMRNYGKATDNTIVSSEREVNYRNSTLFRPVYLKKEGANFSYFKEKGLGAIAFAGHDF